MFACFIEIWQKKEIAKFQSNKTKPVLLLHKKIVIEFKKKKYIKGDYFSNIPIVLFTL